jgi:hypothetical protein
MDATQNSPRRRVLGFILEAAKLIGIAIVCLLVIGVVVILSAKTGIKVPERWIGLSSGLVFCSGSSSDNISVTLELEGFGSRFRPFSSYISPRLSLF